jgi:hypothetical protein
MKKKGWINKGGDYTRTFAEPPLGVAKFFIYINLSVNQRYALGPGQLVYQNNHALVNSEGM